MNVAFDSLLEVVTLGKCIDLPLTYICVYGPHDSATLVTILELALAYNIKEPHLLTKRFIHYIATRVL